MTRADVRNDRVPEHAQALNSHRNNVAGWPLDDFMHVAAGMQLKHVIGKITCALLITHGANDRQIYVECAQQSFDEAVNASKKSMRLFN